ncbi:MAG: response regulator [Candidatus Omnitrophota bacterium]
MDKFKLLIVDDEEGIVEFVKKAYEMKGFMTFGATDGIAAVDIFERERPEISLIDIHMPYSPIDGIETLRRIKKIDKDAVCLMITRIDEKKQVEEARELGALHYIMKPVTIAEMDVDINEAVEIINKRRK